jgi:serine-type D-Ala-D-Ala carboxypeptidase
MTGEQSAHRGLRELLDLGVNEGAFTEGHAWVAHDGQPLAHAHTAGVTVHSLWDVASLTKPMATVTEVMRAVGDGVIDLDERVRSPTGLDTTVRALLGHRSGLPAWDDLWAVAEGLGPGWQPGARAVKDAIAARIGALAGSEPATRYSDLGFISLGWHLERRLKQPLDELVTRWHWGAPTTGQGAAQVVPTGHCPRRLRQAHGEVDDLNAWVLGGVAGHAGLFATANDVGSWALELSNSAAGRGGAIDGGVIREFWDRTNIAGSGSTWVLGWDTPTLPDSTAGARASLEAVGHLGFTGTSVWIDRAHDLIVVLLTDRAALGAPSKAVMRNFRPRFHDGVRDLLDL